MNDNPVEDYSSLPIDGRVDWKRRIACATLYNEVGNMRLVAEKMEVSYDTLNDWKRQDWWPRLIDEIRAGKAAKRNLKLSSIIDQSIDLIADRISNGEFHINEDNEIKRVPVKLKDISKLTVELLNHQIKQEEIADKVTERRETVQETLALLAKEFKKLNRNKDKETAETIEYKE